MGNIYIREDVLMNLKEELRKILETLVKYLENPEKTKVIVKRRDLINRIYAHLDDIIYKVTEAISKIEKLNIPARLKPTQDLICSELSEIIECFVTIKGKTHELISKEEIKKLLLKIKTECNRNILNVHKYILKLYNELSQQGVIDTITISECNEVLRSLGSVCRNIGELNKLMEELGEIGC